MNAIVFQKTENPASLHAAADSGNMARVVALALIAVRFMQGFIYWGGGSRRFIYAPAKLNPHAAHWMANKFQSAMPGAILGVNHIISYMLHHFALLYTGMILFSAAELIAGLCLMMGLYTRVAALVSMGFSVLLMLMFGWQGATCIDEWTMAACNLAMGATLFLGGGGAYALDNVLLRNKPWRENSALFRWTTGCLPLPVSSAAFHRLALCVLAFVVVFNLGTYHHYRGSVVTPFHDGPVSPTIHHVTVSEVTLALPQGVRFHAALDAGTSEAPVHIVHAALLNANRQPVVQWDAQALSRLPGSAFSNDYAYNRFAPGPFGFRAPMGAAAWITLPVPAGDETGSSAATTLQLTDVDGRQFTAAIGKTAQADLSQAQVR